MGGGGGGTPYIPPPPPPPEKVQMAKPVTEAATAARATQRDKAAKAAGIMGSIHTKPLGEGMSGSGDAGHNLLGQ